MNSANGHDDTAPVLLKQRSCNSKKKHIKLLPAGFGAPHIMAANGVNGLGLAGWESRLRTAACILNEERYWLFRGRDSEYNEVCDDLLEVAT